MRRAATDLAWPARLAEQRCPGDLERRSARGLNGLDLFSRAVEAPDADDKSRQVCLTAIWFAAGRSSTRVT